jgi:short-chain fatty acids transporter
MSETAPKVPESTAKDGGTWISRVALRFTDFTEKWLPDALGFVLVGTFLIFAL